MPEHPVGARHDAAWKVDVDVAVPDITPEVQNLAGVYVGDGGVSRIVFFGDSAGGHPDRGDLHHPQLQWSVSRTFCGS